jgi:outer membrane protein assembly factor BamB
MKQTDLQSVDPYKLEQLIGDLWQSKGYETHVRKGSSDRGVDVEAVQAGYKEVIQVKRYTGNNKVGSKDIREYATLYQQIETANQVVVVTTGEFTTNAKELAKDLRVDVLDGSGLVEEISKHSVDLQEYLPTGASDTEEDGDTSPLTHEATDSVPVKQDFQTGVKIASPLSIGSNNVIYFIGADGHVYAFNSNGNQKWSFGVASHLRPTTSDNPFSPTVGDGTIYVGCYDKYIYALNSNDGTEQWSYKIGNKVGAAPAVGDDIICVGSQSNVVYALNANNGTKRWQFQTEHEIWSSPIVIADTVYVGSWDANIYAIDRDDGTEQWHFETSSGINSSPTVVNNTVYITSRDSNIYALDTNDGTEKWRFQTDGRLNSSPTVANYTVYFGSDNNVVYAVYTSDGTERWKFSAQGRVRSSPVYANRTIYVGADDGNVYALDATDGTEQWHFQTDGQFRSSPAISGGIMPIRRSDERISILSVD